MIKFENIAVSFNDTKILENFNLEINSFEFVSIIGSSGCGKTTALKLVNRLLEPKDGAIYIDEININTMDEIKLRRNIGYVIQNIGLFPHMSIKENMAYVLHLLKKNQDEIDQRIEELLKIVNIDKDLLNRYPDELSGGQKQRVGIARALATKPNILLMDEPFGAVDEITKRGLQEELKKIHESTKVTIIFITHDIKEALKLSDRIVVMNNGKIDQFATPTEILNNPATDFVKLLVS